MFTNFIEECRRKNITRQQLADLWGVSYNTACEKVNGKSRMYLEEAFKVNRVFFPEFTPEYLFYPVINEN